VRAVVVGLVIVAAAMAATVATRLILGAPARELPPLFAALALTGLGGLALVALLARIGHAMPVGWQLTAAAIVGILLVLANVAVSASLMFFSTHDLELLLILCAFACFAAAGPLLLLSRQLGVRIRTVEAASRRVAEGDFQPRLPIHGRDEIARLSAAFNEMAQALSSAAAERSRAETSRRNLYAAISHDLRTPLSSMRAMVEAMTDGVVVEEETRERYLHAIDGEVNHLTALIDDLFELSRIENGQLQLRLAWLGIDDVVRQAMDSFRPQVERAGVRLHFEAGTTPDVRADPDRIVRVIYNLLHNALRHTPHDGAIVLSTAAAGSEVQVTISDTGEGIAPDDVPFVFDRFFRGDRSRTRDGSGAGLGLAIARGIVESHGGRIWVERTGSRGTAIAFTLPLFAG
jgi:two-component system, OmpR family, sensor histidine kinase SaeS